MEKANAQDFRRKMLTPTIPITNLEIEEDIDYDGSFGKASLQISSLDIKGCVFGKVSLKMNVGKLSFINCRFNEIEIELQHPSEIIDFDDCKIGNLKIKSSPDVLLHDLIIKNGSIIEKSSIYGMFKTLELNSITINNDCEIKLTQSGNLNLINVSIHELAIRGSVKETVFRQCTNTEIFIIKLQGDFIGLDLCEKCKFTIVESRVDNFLVAESPVEINYENHYGLVSLFRGQFGKLKITKKFEGKIEAFSSLGENGNVEIESLTMTDSVLSETSELLFDGVTIKELEFHSSGINGSLRIVNSLFLTKFSIIESNMGKSKFTNIHLGDNCVVNILDSDIDDTTFNSFRWNKDFKLSEKNEDRFNKDDYDFLISRRESYRQLKSNQLKSNNKIASLEFQRNELHIHFLIIKRQLSNEWEKLSIHGKFLSTLGDFLILWTHKHASGFGLNIWRPLFLLFIVHLILFNIFLLYNTDLNLYPLCDISGEATLDAASKYFYTIIPTHSFMLQSFEAKNGQCFIGGFWDLLIRVSSAYFIFYFISASRKYHSQ